MAGLGLSTLFMVLVLIERGSSASLYDENDEVVLLNVDNFYSTVLGKEHAWLIEFYSSWCGHCINFAPTWKAFAADIKDWQHTIKVGVLDCADGSSLPICREYEVNYYPNIRVFPSMLQRGEYGAKVDKRGVGDMRRLVLEYLVTQQEAGNASSTWINLLPLQGPEEDVWAQVPDSASHVIFLDNMPDPYIAREVIMDLGGYKEIAVVLKSEEYDNTSSAQVIYLGRDGWREAVDVVAEREEVREMQLIRFDLDRERLDFSRPSVNVSELEDDEESEGFYTKAPGSTSVYLVDIENAVSYALRHEVVTHKVIEGESLDALMDFLEVLVLYLPARPPVHKYLKMLHSLTEPLDSVKGEDFSAMIRKVENKSMVLPLQQPWIGCRGSTEGFRGYPCGLWTLFHALTVNAALTEGSNPDYVSKKVLRAIHGYVVHFFGCKHCSQHFDEMYRVDAESSVNDVNDEVLWLWNAHNKVNERLKGDKSEDPEHPKVQFPTQSQCPECWNADIYDETEVLSFLKDIYNKYSLLPVGTQAIDVSSLNKQSFARKVVELSANEGQESNKETVTHNDAMTPIMAPFLLLTYCLLLLF